ncbi:MAG TPA: ATP-binding cassette domain-containing protein [Actinomycetes bacterium]|jgi:iron complex transport system ATP-binding protein|nr:ATP-binding cassette domain-containing protein [Actinomycetes bacterium]
MAQVDGAGQLCLELEGVQVWTPEGVDLLRAVTWRVRAGEHWALLGPNGAGKSTLLSLAGARRHPSAGSVRVLGARIGGVDMRELRGLIGVVDPALRMPDELSAETVVLTGASGSVQPLWERYGAAERARARELLELLGCAHLASRQVGTCSHGERGRIRIARALLPAPRLLLLDEPASGLDLAARERLLSALSDLAAFAPELATVVVSHHLEDLPPRTSHALLLAGGEVVASGPVEGALTGETVSACFGLPLRLRCSGGRWTAVGSGQPLTAGRQLRAGRTCDPAR